MAGFFRHRHGLGRELRDARPRPSEPLVRSIETRVEAGRSLPRRRLLRLAPAAAFTAVLVGGLAATGGFGYAASGVRQAADSISKVFVSSKGHGPVIVRILSSGHDQYRPGYGWGDPNHTHTGPPGLSRKPGSSNLVAHQGRTQGLGRFEIVKTKFTVDEQAHLFISITTGKHSKRRLPIAQRHSRVGHGVKGRATKRLSYIVLVPRTIRLKLAIPKVQLQRESQRRAGNRHRYYIHIKALAPNGQWAQLYIPFKA